ncbi:FHA domain containing protein [Anaeromyxobacter sp. K]|uniref:FHA domain-containing protein n=1 Tax=Anaeromyxobacter sp. (strain K) TaxID=447217 RepID=UPI00017BE3E8|nr:FHA domain-containing protein [Anaeromyxobacter sp. K]ACG75009.1 FHA domain containing protein [Anaeromyxobacter sp. K]
MKLVIEDAEGTWSVVPFDGDEVSVGRAPEGNSFHMADRDVSRRHARFVRAGGAVFVEDLGSLTGTRVNGERISGRRRLREGDLVEIGAYDLALLPDVDAAGAGAPPPIPHGARTPDPTAGRRTPEPGAAAPPPGRPTPPSLRIPVPAAAVAPAAPTPAAAPAPAPSAQPPPAAAAPSRPTPRPSAPAQAAFSTAPLPAAPAVAPPGPRASRTGRTVALALVAGAVALALGIAAGWTVGRLGAAPAAEPPGAPASR